MLINKQTIAGQLPDKQLSVMQQWRNVRSGVFYTANRCPGKLVVVMS
jgi:hypothetical protein